MSTNNTNMDELVRQALSNCRTEAEAMREARKVIDQQSVGQSRAEELSARLTRLIEEWKARS